MSSQNYFDLLGDDENEEPTAVIARATLPSPAERITTRKSQTLAVASSPVRLPIKPPPPTELVKEFKHFEGGRGGRGGGRGWRGGRSVYGERDRDGGSREGGTHRESSDGFSRDRSVNHDDLLSSTNRDINSDGYQGNRGSSHVGSDATFGFGGGGGYGGDKASREGGETWPAEISRARGGRGGRGRERGPVVDGEERPRRREFDRRSGSGLGNEIKRDGSGRGNWGAEGDQGSQQELVETATKEEVGKVALEGEKMETEKGLDGSVPSEDGADKKEEEDTELTLDEYEKILEEKRKALLASKVEERKVQADKAFASMQLVDKKNEEDIFIKLGSDKEKKKKEKEALEKEEKARKTQSINEFLKPADGEKYYGTSGSRGRSRGRGGRSGDGDRGIGFGARGAFAGGFSSTRGVAAPRIEDPGQFPTLGTK